MFGHKIDVERIFETFHQQVRLLGLDKISNEAKIDMENSAQDAVVTFKLNLIYNHATMERNFRYLPILNVKHHCTKAQETLQRILISIANH